ncbi:MAG: flagellar filament capping protein FliD [Terracidiphilus sp.]|nr:flagellar filament capping protein FliD [Terracidiphilus sp.]MDR3776940.1 flagellar filament capping protein FliD [Terracidiphilus sp.]
MSIGLSFGSPTSGNGFDVTATVSSIVANLQNVETPWKTQLTTLESENTVLSSLGTLMSTLSNDISTLTDATGVLSEKTGSSSNTNVLELTSASTTAIAGTHMVVVNSLAKTSSGYLTEITNSSDTLSGSMTITVGSGTKQTISLDNTTGYTLSDLASAINSAGIGVTASVLTDSSGSRLSLVSGTSGADGNLTVSSSITDSSNSNASLSYKSAVTGSDGSLTVDGIDLTISSNTVSNLIPGVTFQVLATSSSEVQVVIGNYNTGVESAVSTMVTDYNSLISAINTQEGNDSSGNAEPLYGSPTLSLLQQNILGGINTQNPNGYLKSITNSSDTLSGSISITVGSGTAQTISLDDTTGYTLSDLASAINSASIGVTASVSTTSTGSSLVLVSQTTGSSGALKVASSITDSTTSTSLAYTNSSDITGLTSLGISVNSDGTLSLSTTSLDSILNSDYSGVQGLFQNANSWGVAFSTMLTESGSTSSTGILKLAKNSNSSIESTLNADISKEDLLISSESKSITAVMNSANAILQEIPMQISEVNELYSAITGYSSSK